MEKIKITKEIEEARKSLDEGYLPVECSYGQETIVKNEKEPFDHHNKYSHLPTASLQALKSSVHTDKVVVNHADLDCVMASAILLGEVSRSNEWIKKLVEINEITDTRGLHALSDKQKKSPEFELALYFYQQHIKPTESDFKKGIDILKNLQKGPNEKTTQARDTEQKRIEESHKGNVRIEGKVGLVNSKVFGFDIWYQKAPVIVAFNPHDKKIGVGIIDEKTAKEIFGPSGLVPVYKELDKITGPGWGGRASIGGSPRNLDGKLTFEDTEKVFKKVCELANIKKAALQLPAQEMRDAFKNRTDKHIQRVINNIEYLITMYPDLDKNIMREKEKNHDQSKYQEPENTPYVWLNWYKQNNHGKTFDETRNTLPDGVKKEVQKATDHHIINERHHPECLGCENMLFEDITEMVADWWSMSQELGTGLREWADKNIPSRWDFPTLQKSWIYDMISTIEKKENQKKWAGLRVASQYMVLSEEVEDKSQDDPSKQTSAVEKLIKTTINEKIPEYKNKVYAVGGFVRDNLMGKRPKDIDLMVDDSKEKMDGAKIFAKKLTDALGITTTRNPHPLSTEYGIWGVILANPKEDGKRKPYIYDGIDISGYIIEITPPREEGPYDEKKRRPSWVKYTDIDNDAKRRDLTINAIYKNIATGEIKDPVGGKKDITNKVLRPPQHPGGIEKIYEEDPLRILRYIRFQGKTGFNTDPGTINTLKKFIASSDGHKLISTKIAKERIRDELEKILVGPKPSQGMELIKDLGLLSFISPELERLLDFYHDTVYHRGESVWEHTMEVLDKTPASLNARLGALFHDIGKLETQTKEDDRIHYIGHEEKAPKLINKILSDLKFPKTVIKSVRDIAHAHMSFKTHKMEKIKPSKLLKKMRIFIEKLYTNMDDALAVMKADARTEADSKRVDELKDELKKLKDDDIKKGLLVERGGEVSYTSPISGSVVEDLKKEYQQLTGKTLGAILNKLKQMTMSGKFENKEESERINEAKKIVRGLVINKEQLENIVKNYEDELKSDKFFSIKKARKTTMFKKVMARNIVSKYILGNSYKTYLSEIDVSEDFFVIQLVDKKGNDIDDGELIENSIEDTLLKNIEERINNLEDYSEQSTPKPWSLQFKIKQKSNYEKIDSPYKLEVVSKEGKVTKTKEDIKKWIIRGIFKYREEN